ncbi:MAG TPA: lysophospholipid acyltransferase family protein [Syntrophales bacterium]|nr:lysophospholipid acyltransferase family protein [Syntrophales bacterium]
MATQPSEVIKPTLMTKSILIFFKAIPLPFRKALFRGLFTLVYHLLTKQRLITLHNLKCAFPEKEMPELIGIAKGVYSHLAIVMAEFFEIPWITKDNYRQWVEFEGLENIEKALVQGKGVLSIVAHLGNWEMMTMAFPMAAYPIQIVYRPLDNPVLDNLFGYVRSLNGNSLIPKTGALRSMLMLLRQNKIVGIMGDQNMSAREGVFVEFFGRPACTTVGLAFMALKTGVPVVPAFMIRMKNGKYRFIIEPAVDISNTGDLQADVKENTQRFTRIIEHYVRLYPEQWFWLHQRWKTKPWQVKKRS